MVVDGHLGGYVPGGDPDTTYPALWSWLVQEQGIQSVIDIGCGDGVAVDYFTGLGASVLGIDGIPQEHPLIIEHDYTLGPFVTAISDEQPDRYDLAWSCEFVEHIEEQYVENFLATFACADLVLMTSAGPGQRGWHHVNCQPVTYWMTKMREIGYVPDEIFTVDCRTQARKNPGDWNHFVRSGMAYRRST